MDSFFNSYSVDLLIGLILIFFGSAFISGLTGFGFGLIGAFVLFLLPPKEAVPMLMMMSVFIQTLNIASLKENIHPLKKWWSIGPAPYILGGLIGVPIGLRLLLKTNPLALDEWIGLLLMCYSIVFFVWKKQRPLVIYSTPWKVVFGFLGGIFGGFAAVPAFPILVFGKISGWNKGFQRSITQPFILILQVVSLFEFFISGNSLHIEFFFLLLILIVPVLIGNRLGFHYFKIIKEAKFQKVVLLILFLSGLSLIIKGRSFLLDFFHQHHLNLFP